MTDTATEVRPQRTCYGCGETDNHPRFTHIVDWNDDSKDEQYHYGDCIPAGVVKHHGLDDSSHPSHKIHQAALKGTRGDELHALAVKHAHSLKEAPAHPGQES